jgi:O-acetylserine/cysteine efflux transporter
MSGSVQVAAPPVQVEGRDLSMLLTMNVIWGLNLVACKLGVDEFPPIFLTALRFITLAVMLVPWLRLQSGQMRMLLQAALLTGPVTFAMLFLGIARISDVSSVAIASQLSVPFSTLLSVWLLGEHIHWRRRLGIVLAFAGVAVISLDPHMFSSRLGLLLVAMSSFSGALGLICIKQLRYVKPLELQAWIATSGVLLLLPLSLLLETGQLHAMRAASWQAWTALAYTALMSSLVGHTAWYYLVGKYPVTNLAPITLLTPIFGVVFGVLLLGDALTQRMIVGGAITLLGVYIVVRRERKIFDTGS